MPLATITRRVFARSVRSSPSAIRHAPATSRLGCTNTTHRSLSADPGHGGIDDAPPPPRSKQSFVLDGDAELMAGELETDLPPGFHQGHRRHENDGRDSYWRPPVNNAHIEILSKDDFNNRPRIQFGEGFQSLHDGQITLSWLTQSDKHNMYSMYVSVMTAQSNNQKKGGSKKKKAENADDVKEKSWGVLSAHTSHEYTIRLIAQKFNVSTSSAAAVIQLQHDEEQLKKDPNFKLYHDVQNHVDNQVNAWIREVYQSYGEKAPLGYMEDPVSSTGLVGREDSGSPDMMRVSDLQDVDLLVRKTEALERETAISRMGKHVFVEDVDDSTRNVRLDSETKDLMTRASELRGLYDVKEEDHDANDGKGGANEDPRSDTSSKRGQKKGPERLLKIPKAASPFPDNNRGYKDTLETRRPRWRYAAQIINTHKLKHPPNQSRHGVKVAARAKARRHGRVVDGNTIIEEGGELRAATVAELEQTSWKHVRNESEVMFRGVKDAWLRKELHGESGGWGLQKEINPIVEKSETPESEDDNDAVESESKGDEDNEVEK
ncbi:hypothetical protein THAOC_14541 [Thalassiosira oceanica]|uniref:Uncharacterized protein n=1 Tax=Thalassiosira oceanica TaxID=159749 RepID=K0T2U2_THAOC|nr:hypothetical protein THAOC_14541 [Thalassiosira oceanica]|mmetsp:Transcript_9305/g.21093  ORF Transcript_9305/g.21093 Transcript_9305/m.21093 type:complete len:548 (+) Transcript_9305:104-1747(+)|eukprot:EJK64697.1 hypothetical protein THAOC_14541 [Thalassiosira oceanica]